MGYRIMYSPEDNSKYPMKSKRTGRGKWFAAAAAGAAILLCLGMPQWRYKAAQWLLPGDPVVTKAAFAIMLEELRSGDSVADAVTAFCQEILNETPQYHT